MAHLRALCLALLAGCVAANVWDPTRIEMEIKPTVVSIQKHCEIPFEGSEVGEFFATGFIVDAEHGIIATNKHVTGTSPAFFKASFYDGSLVEAVVLWYDPIEDFAFLQVDTDNLPNLRAVNITTNPRPVVAGDDVMLVGNNEGKDFSLKTGQVANLIRPSTSRRNIQWQTTFDRTGGASGSPVFDKNYEVVAIHAAGTDTTSMEVPISLVSRVLNKITAQLSKAKGTGITVPRGELGFRLDLITMGDAKRYFGMPEKMAAAETKRQMEAMEKHRTGGAPCAAVVSSLVPGMGKMFQLGDILVSVGEGGKEGKAIGCDLLMLAEEIDDAAASDDKEVTLEVIRAGVAKKLSVPVIDSEASKVKHFLQIAGAIFHEVTPTYRLKYCGTRAGVWLSYASPGSVFNEVGLSEREKPGYVHVLVVDIEGEPVKNLDDFAKQVVPRLQAGVEEEKAGLKAKRRVLGGADLFLNVIDYKMDDLVERAVPLSLQSRSADFDWQYDLKKLRWTQKPLLDGVRASAAKPEQTGADLADAADAGPSAPSAELKAGVAQHIKALTAKMSKASKEGDEGGAPEPAPKDAEATEPAPKDERDDATPGSKDEDGGETAEPAAADEGKDDDASESAPKDEDEGDDPKKPASDKTDVSPAPAPKADESTEPAPKTDGGDEPAPVGPSGNGQPASATDEKPDDAQQPGSDSDSAETDGSETDGSGSDGGDKPSSEPQPEALSAKAEVAPRVSAARKSRRGSDTALQPGSDSADQDETVKSSHFVR